MKIFKLMIAFGMAVALLLPAGLAFSQGRMADIDDAKKLLESNSTANNRLRLATLQYLEGTDYLKTGDMNKAIDSLQAAVWTLEDGKGQVPDTHPVFEEARYGLGYALLRNNNAYEALLVLDQVVTASPDFGKARYLLGVTLMNIPGEKSLQRGQEVLGKLAKDGRAPYNEWAAHAATRYGYDLSTLNSARGDASGANTTLSTAVNAVGANKGANDGENNMVHFAQGVYLRDSGDALGALDQFEAAYKSDSGFRTANGVALSGVLSNAYYGAGLQQLQAGGDSANHLAVEMFDNAGRVGDATALDVHHGKAVAYTRLGETDNAVKELQAIVAKDASYYDKIKKK
jgi:tetratricopeptide (TPR) repeat protein